MRSCRASGRRSATDASDSSTTSSRTSTSSSTSDRIAARLAALARLVHPFPSILDGLVVVAVGLVAGGEVSTVTRLGLSMTALQFAIGALNDIVDAPADVGRIPPKPIPSGVVSAGEARAVVLVAAIAGLALAWTVSVGVVAIGIVVLAIGAAYDLVAKGTPWSWLPFALGIPLLPVYGWFGATGDLPPFFSVLLPMAVLAGAALAIANARADLEADLVSGTASVATRLGSRGSWWVGASLMAAATAIGLLFIDRSGFSALTVVLVAAGTALVAVGAIVGRGSGQPALRRAWEAQAVGAAVAATGWVAAMTRLSL